MSAGTAYDIQQLQVVTPGDLPELEADVLPSDGHAIPAVDLSFGRSGATYDVAYKPDDAPLKPAGDKPPLKSATDKPLRKPTPAGKPPSKPATDKLSAKGPPKRTHEHEKILTDPTPSPKLRAGDAQIAKAREQVRRLKEGIPSVILRVQSLDPEIQEKVFTGEVKIDLEHMMKELEDLNRERKLHKDQFEWIMAEKYGPLKKRIKTIHAKIDELERQKRERAGITEQAKRFIRIDQWP